MNGRTKTDLTCVSGNHLKIAAEVDDVSVVDTKKLAAAVMKGTKGCSPALECKILFEFEGTTGERSLIGNITRERE